MIVVKNRVLLIPETERYIGTPYDNNSEIRTFQIERAGSNGVDLSALSFRLDLQYKSGKKDTALLTKEVTEEKIFLNWGITNSILQEPGTIYINIRATDTAGGVKWTSFQAAVYVEHDINTPGEQGNGLTELEQLEARLDKKMEQMDTWADSIDEQETGRQENEQVRQNQETERQKNEIEREKKTQEVINTFGTAIGEAKDAAKLSESWAVGGTGTRDGEDGDNSKYYCKQSQAEADRAKIEADKAAAFSEIVPPVFRIEQETMELIQETAATGIKFSLTEEKELCIEFAKEEQGGKEDAAADHMQIWENKTNITTLTDKTNTLAPGIVLDAKGGAIAVHNASDQPFVGLKVYGKSEQFKTTGAQLFDAAEAEMNAILDMDGTTSANGNINTSGFVKVSPNTKYSVSSTRQNRGKFYDINKRVLTTDKFDFELSNSRDKFTTPENVEYVRFSIYGTENLNNVMVNVGDTLKPWEPYTGGKPSPSLEYQQDIVNAGEGGSITVEVKGRNLLKPNSYNTYYEFPLKANTVITLMTNGKPSQGGNIKFSATDGSNVWFSIDTGQTRVCRSIGNKDVKGFYDLLKVGGGLEYMFAVGDIKTYTPYIEPQSITLATPNGLAGIPVTTGGNYVDETGQQWITDEIDCDREVKIQRIEKCKVNYEVVTYNHSTGYASVSGIKKADVNHLNAAMCTHLITKTGMHFWIDSTGKNFRFKVDAFSTEEEYKEFFRNNNVEVAYVLAEMAETPLTPEEITAYKALHTYSPNTTIVNDGGCGMSVEYVADTKTYIKAVEDKITAIHAALINQNISGGGITVDDAAELPISSLQIFGKSEQVQTTGAQIWDNRAAMKPEFWSGEKGYKYAKLNLKPNTTYTLSVGQNNMHKDYKAEYVGEFAFYIGETPGVASPNLLFGNTNSDIKVTEKSFTTTDKPFYFNLFCGKWSTENIRIALTELLQNIMLVEGSVAKPWEPYTGGKPSPSPEYPQEIVNAGDNGTLKVKVTDSGEQSQSLILATPNGLPGIPVKSGGNYTDSTGQQWICDEIDLERGKYVQRIRQVKFNGTENWKHRITNSGNNNFQILIYDYKSVAGTGQPCFCNYLSYTNIIWDDNVKNLPKIYSYNTEITVSFPPESEFKSVETWKNWLKEKENFEFWYALAEPIITPLSPEEIAAYKSLQLYSPNTTITNDAGCEMSLTYTVDTQRYVDKKIAAISAAMIGG